MKEYQELECMQLTFDLAVHTDLPKGLLTDIFIFKEQFKLRLLEIEEMLTENRIWKQRLVDIGVVSLDQAQDWGFSGVLLRGSGLEWDYEKINLMKFMMN